MLSLVLSLNASSILLTEAQNLPAYGTVAYHSQAYLENLNPSLKQNVLCPGATPTFVVDTQSCVISFDFTAQILSPEPAFHTSGLPQVASVWLAFPGINLFCSVYLTDDERFCCL